VVKNVEHIKLKIKIDKQGRMVIPSKVRRVLGIYDEMEGVLSVRGRKIIIEFIDNNLKERVEKWYEDMKRMKVQAFSSKEVIPKSKWMSDEYAKRKLGL